MTSKSNLIIWGRRNSFNVQKVMWLVEELNCSYQHIAVGGTFGGLEPPSFLAMNPHGKIPVISDNGNIVWESHSILRYIAAQYGKINFGLTIPLKDLRLNHGWIGNKQPFNLIF